MATMIEQYPLTSASLKAECHNIAKWWINHAVDNTNGGFYGEISERNRPVTKANKGLILNARILWFFSEAAITFDNDEYGKIATRAFNYLLNHFDDKQHGGVFWEVNAVGQCSNDKKQVYAQSFAIYGLSALFLFSRNERAKEKALEYFALIEKHAVDKKSGGYLEAFAGDWSEVDDVRLSHKDKNSPKTMNTHIHILEAYTCLYRATKDAKVASSLKALVGIVCDKILDANTHHLRVFMTLDWQDVSDAYSYGHDIESSWLVWDAIASLNDKILQQQYEKTVIKMAEVCLAQSLGESGQVCDQFTFKDKKTHSQSFWWVQAEALVGFLNAFQLTGNAKFLEACESIWQFTQEQHIDLENGEWLWSAKSDLVKDINACSYKAGFWKGPYHNGRAMMEASALLSKIESYIRGKSNANVM